MQIGACGDGAVVLHQAWQGLIFSPGPTQGVPVKLPSATLGLSVRQHPEALQPYAAGLVSPQSPLLVQSMCSFMRYAPTYSFWNTSAPTQESMLESKILKVIFFLW